MNTVDLEHEHLIVLPRRLETIVLVCAPLTTTHQATHTASQTSNVIQNNVNVQNGGCALDLTARKPIFKRTQPT